MPKLERLVRRNALPDSISEKSKLVNMFERDADIPRAASPAGTAKKQQLHNRKKREDEQNGVSRVPERVLVRLSAVHEVTLNGNRVVKRFIAMDGDGDLQVVTREQRYEENEITVDPLPTGDGRGTVVHHHGFRPQLSEIHERAAFVFDRLLDRPVESAGPLQIIQVWPGARTWSAL
jgi:hypothetical protein